MIIMGRRGKKSFRRLVMGSTTAWTIGHSPCSVMAVPRAAYVEFKSIGVATTEQSGRPPPRPRRSA